MKEIIATTEAPAAIGPYSQAIKAKAGRLIFTAGQIPLEPQTGDLVAGDIKAQTRRVLENLKDFLLVEASDDGITWSVAARYSGATDWMQSLVPLDQFAGPGKTSVHIRFRLLTDATGQDEGVSIDDVEMAIVPRTTVADPAAGQAEVAGEFALSQSYPNPFSIISSSMDARPAVVEFALPEPSHVRLQVHDLTGRRVALLADGNFSPGSHRCNWNGWTSDGTPLASGLYILRLVATSLRSGQRHTLSRTVTLLK